MPVADLPSVACETWRLRTDSDFVLEIEGDFQIGEITRTLVLNFAPVFALAAHEDMLGKTMATTSQFPKIGTGPHAIYRFPLSTIANSGWLASISGPVEECSHFLLLSLTCTVEVIAVHHDARWR